MKVFKTINLFGCSDRVGSGLAAKVKGNELLWPRVAAHEGELALPVAPQRAPLCVTPRARLRKERNRNGR